MKTPSLLAVFVAAVSVMGCGKSELRTPSEFDALMDSARKEYSRNKHAAVFAENAAQLPGATPGERVKAYRLAAEIRAYVGDQAGAQRRLLEALELDPSDHETLAQLAGNTREKPEEALTYADRAVRAAGRAPRPRKAAIIRQRAEILLDTGDDGGARRDARAALALAPGDLETLRLLARVDRDDRPAAEAHALAADAAAAEAPEWLRPAAERLAARVWLDLEAYAQAAEAYRRALAVDPDDQAALYGLVNVQWKRPGAGLARVATPDPGAAPFGPPWKEWTAKALSRAKRSEPDGVEAWRLRAASELDRGLRQDALESARQCAKAAAHAPLWQQAAADRLAARMFLDLGSESDAAIVLDHAHRLEPNSVHNLLIGSSLRKAGHSPQFTSVNESLGYREIAEARWDLGDAAGAKAALDKALAADPNDASVQSFARKMRGLPR